MVSAIQQAVNETTITGATTLGWAPGQVTPPLLLLCNAASGNYTVTLPTINASIPTPPTQAVSVPGTGGGFRITVMQLAASGTVTVAAAGTDTIVGTATLASQNAVSTFQAVTATNTWYKVS